MHAGRVPAEPEPPDVPTWIAFDTETTGLEPGSQLVELAAIAFTDAGTVASFDQLVRPTIAMPPDVVSIHGLRDEDLHGANNASVVLQQFLDWLPDDAVLVAHNAGFDCDVLGWEADRAQLQLPDLRVIDTVPLARTLNATANCRLQTLCEHFSFQRLGDAHRALPDADSVRQLFLQLRRDLPEHEDWEPRVPRHGWQTVADEELPAPLHGLADALRAGRALEFTYRDARGHETRRAVTPWGYARVDAGIRFHGHCHLRQARRHFAAERVSA